VAYGGCEDAGLVGAGVKSGTAIAERLLHRVAAKGQGQGHRGRHINIVKRETGWPMQPGAHGAHLSNCLYPLASTIVL
jgi:hypothetical protein